MNVLDMLCKCAYTLFRLLDFSDSHLLQIDVGSNYNFQLTSFCELHDIKIKSVDAKYFFISMQVLLVPMQLWLT